MFLFSIGVGRVPLLPEVLINDISPESSKLVLVLIGLSDSTLTTFEDLEFDCQRQYTSHTGCSIINGPLSV